MTLPVHFQEPRWLLAALLAAPLAVVALRWFASMSRVRRWSAVVLRTLLVVLLASMLAGASAVRETRRVAVVGVLDVSESVRRFGSMSMGADGSAASAVDRMRGWLQAAFASRRSDDLAGLVVFDGRSVVIASPSLGDPLARSLEVEPVEGTDIGAALRRAAALIPPDAAGRIVLFSDGNDTAGGLEGALRALASAQPGGVPVDVVEVEYDAENEVLVEAVDAPPRASEGATVTVRVTLRATSPTRGTLRLLREGEVVDLNGEAPGSGRRVALDAGVQTELLEVPLPPGRLHRFSAIFEPDVVETERGPAPLGDTVLANNRGEAFTLAPGAGSILLLDGTAGGGGVLAETLRDGGAEVEVLAPEAMPGDLLGLQAHDLVILVNVPAELIHPERQELLATFVRDLGGGLVMVGGYDAFGAGGWKGSPIEPILPVRLDLPEKAVVPEAAIVFVLDRSGSMSWNVMGSARNKQQIANEAAALAVQSLDERDLIGVIAFSTGASVVVPLGPNDDPQRTAQRILSISPGGGTNIGVGLAEARRQLSQVDAKIKHVIVLTDGQSVDSARLPGMSAAMSEEGIRITTIGVGEDADAETLDAMAAQGGGTFHQVLNPNVLPQIFLRAVRVVRQPMVREQPFEPAITGAGSPYTAGIPDPPPLGGLVLTQRREDPRVVDAMLTPLGEPVLSHWNVELGQVVAFTSDAHGNWSRNWIDWPGYRTFWNQLVQLAARSAGKSRYDLRMHAQGGELRIRVEAYEPDGSPRDLLSMPATLYGPSGEPREIRLSQTGPGIYEAALPAGGSGSYIALIKPELAGQRLSPIIGGAAVASGLESRALSSDRSTLEAIASATGGRVLSMAGPAGADLFGREGLEPRRAMTPIWRPLLLLALAVLLLDVGTRRIAWDRLVSREFGADLREAALEQLRARGEQASRAAGGLRSQSERLRAARRGADSPAMGDREAQELAARTLRERQSTRLEALRAARLRAAYQPAQDATPPALTQPPQRQTPRQPAKPPQVKPADATEADGTSGLLAAKRRARERYGGAEEEQG